MPSLNIENFGDLLNVTLPHIERPDYTSLVTDTTKHVAANQLVPKNKSKISSGKSCDWRVKMNTANAARHISITSNDNTGGIVDGFVTASVNWRKSETKYFFYEEELMINKGEWQIIDLIKSREHGAMVDWVELVENTFWGFTAATDTTSPYGIPYYVTKNATTGFNGGHPSGYTTVAGISATTYPRWQNYTYQHTGPTMDDLIRNVRLMAEETDFTAPVAGIPDIAKGMSRGYYTTLTNKTRLEDLADSRNDNLGVDLAKNDNAVTIRRTPVVYVPKLNSDTTNPFYQLDWSTIDISTNGDGWLKRKVISPYPGQRNVTAVFMDSWWQIVCYNRRKNGIIASGVTYP